MPPALEPVNLFGNVDLGRLLLDMSRAEEAEPYLQAALAQDERNPQALHQLARVLAGRGEHGLDPVQAYLLCSVAVDLRISEIVDVPNFIVTAHCPLGIFE